MCFLLFICLPSIPVETNPLDLERGVRYQILEDKRHSLFYLGGDEYSINVKVDTVEENTALLDVAENEWKQWVGCEEYTTGEDFSSGPLSDPGYTYQVLRRFNCEEYSAYE